MVIIRVEDMGFWLDWRVFGGAEVEFSACLAAGRLEFKRALN